VVNLQKRVSNKWVTKSSDIANATQGDDATTADIHKAASSENKSSFTENAASGSLEFMDATNNTLFSLVPQVLVGAGTSKTLLFSAEFNNNNAALNLTAGTQIRAEVIVTFGNATANGNSTANVDINGNGVLDADEARVRSVPSRLTLTVPAAVAGNASPTLSDTLADIVATGDATVSNVQFNLGATSGAVSATVNGGTNGGSVTNCAHLTSPDQTINSGGSTFTTVPGIDLQSCSTIDVGGTPTCTPGAPGCGWGNDDMRTFTQTQWGDPTSAVGTTLNTNFDGVFPTGATVGGTFTMRFRTPQSIWDYLPAGGFNGYLTANLLDPSSSSSGALGGQVLALKLNVDFSAAGLIPASTSFGNLRICNWTDVPGINGMTVSEVLALLNNVLGGNTSASLDPDTASLVGNFLNNAFAGPSPTAFAQTSLVNASSCN